MTSFFMGFGHFILREDAGSISGDTAPAAVQDAKRALAIPTAVLLVPPE
jgi:hypothetical protein